MLKIGRLLIIASYIYLQFYLKITSRGKKYGGYFFAQLYKNSTDCFVLEILTVDTETLSRYQNRICIIKGQEKENKIS